MLWIGIAAAVMGVLVLIVPDLGALAQAFAFAVLGDYQLRDLLEIRAARIG